MPRCPHCGAKMGKVQKMRRVTRWRGDKTVTMEKIGFLYVCPVCNGKQQQLKAP